MSLYIPLANSEEYTLCLTKIFNFKIEVIFKIISYQRRFYESVDVRSMFCVISHKFTESSIQDSKGYIFFLNKVPQKIIIIN